MNHIPPKNQFRRQDKQIKRYKSLKEHSYGKKNFEENQVHRKKLKMDVEDSELVVFDIETTGGNPEKNGITEIAAVKFKGHQTIESFYSLVNPQIPIPPIVRRMTGIDNRMLKDAPLITEVLPKFLEFLGDRVLISHNAIGDMLYLRHYTKAVTNKTLQNYFLCTHLLVERLAREAPNKSLKGLAKFFEIPAGKLHRAEADAHLTLALFKVLQQKLREEKIFKLEDIIRFQGDFDSAVRMGWEISESRLRELPNQCGVFELVDQNKNLLYAGSSLFIQKEVRRLNNLEKTPKALLKRILRSHEVVFKKYDFFWEALRHEANILEHHYDALSSIPSHHQRSFLCLELQQLTKDQFSFFLGTVKSNTVDAFGPIYDKRYAIDFLSQCAKILDCEINSKGILMLDRSKAEILWRYLKGHKPDSVFSQRESLLQKIQSLFFKSLRQEKLRLKLVQAGLQKMQELNPPKSASLLCGFQGIMVMKNQSIGEALVVGIYESKEVYSHNVSLQSLDVEEQKKIFNKNIVTFKPKKARTIESLGAKQSAHIMAFLHWKYLRKGDEGGEFYPIP